MAHTAELIGRVQRAAARFAAGAVVDGEGVSHHRLVVRELFVPTRQQFCSSKKVFVLTMWKTVVLLEICSSTMGQSFGWKGRLLRPAICRAVLQASPKHEASVKLCVSRMFRRSRNISTK